MGEHFKVDVANISNQKSLKSKNQRGGLKLYQGPNLDLTSSPNHPIWDKSGGKKKKVVKKSKVSKKKVSKKSNPKSTTTKRKIIEEGNSTVDIATLYDKIMVLRGKKKTSTKSYKDHVKVFKFRSGLSPTAWGNLMAAKNVKK